MPAKKHGVHYNSIKYLFQSILAYNGGAVVAMKGDNCVAIATDKRFGIQAQTISTNFPKVYQMGPTLFVGLPGLATDTQTVFQRLKFRYNINLFYCISSTCTDFILSKNSLLED